MSVTGNTMYHCHFIWKIWTFTLLMLQHWLSMQRNMKMKLQVYEGQYEQCEEDKLTVFL